MSPVRYTGWKREKKEKLGTLVQDHRTESEKTGRTGYQLDEETKL